MSLFNSGLEILRQEGATAFIKRSFKYASYKFSYNIYIVGSLLIYFLSTLVHRDNSVWVFGCDFGERFGDNSKYSFIEANKDKYDVTPIWITKDKQVVKSLRKRGFESYYMYSLRGLYFSAISGVIFISHDRRDILWQLSGGTTIIQHWHGNPIKSIEHLNTSWNPSWVKLNIYREYDHVIATSDQRPAEVMKSAMQLSDDQLLVTGYPRNDALLECNNEFFYGKYYNKYEKITKMISGSTSIAYLPTHRSDNSVSNPLLSDYEQLKILNTQMREEDAYFIIKHHMYDGELNDRESLDRILFLPNDMDIYPLMMHFNILITDYSSIYFDFLILNRPIVFFTYDLEEYTTNEREFIYNFEEVTPGPTVESTTELYMCIGNILSDGDGFEHEREALNKSFNKFRDSNSASRVCELIQSRYEP